MQLDRGLDPRPERPVATHHEQVGIVTASSQAAGDIDRERFCAPGCQRLHKLGDAHRLLGAGHDPSSVPNRRTL
jgi:hypothetical protein